MKTRIQLKEVVFANFGKSEATLYKQLPSASKARLKKPGDAICFVSRSFNQVCFVFKPRVPPTAHSGGAQIIQSARVRITRGTWSPMMFQEYAAEVGLSLVGLPGFQESFEKFRRDRALGEI